MRVMVVDDSHVNLVLMSHLLSQLPGVETFCFTDAADALAWSTQHPLALALIDGHLPGQAGIELMRALHREHGRLPVLLLVPIHDAAAKHDALAAGATDWVGKPIDRAEFLARCTTALRLHALPGELRG